MTRGISVAFGSSDVQCFKPGHEKNAPLVTFVGSFNGLDLSVVFKPLIKLSFWAVGGYELATLFDSGFALSWLGSSNQCL